MKPSAVTPSPTARSFAFLVVGKTLSEVGSFIDFVALSTYMYSLTGSAGWVGVFMAVRLFANLAGSLFSAAIIRPQNTKRLLMLADLIRFLSLAALAVAPENIHQPLMFVVIAVLGFLMPVFNVAFTSAVPSMVGEEKRFSANAILGGSVGLAIVVGCVSSAYLPSMLGYRGIFILDAFTFLISAVFIWTSTLRFYEAPMASPALPSMARQIVSGSGLIFQSSILVFLMLIRSLDALGSASHNVALPILSKNMDPIRESFVVGWMWGIWGLGRFFCTFWIGPWTKEQMSKGRGPYFKYFCLFTILMSLGFVGIFYAPSFAWMCASAFLAGIGDAVAEMFLFSYVQKEPQDHRGKILALIHAAERGGLAVGTLVAGQLFQGGMSLMLGVTLFHAMPMIVAIYFFRWLRVNNIDRT